MPVIMLPCYFCDTMVSGWLDQEDESVTAILCIKCNKEFYIKDGGYLEQDELEGTDQSE